MNDSHLGRYYVCKRDGRWRLYDRSACWLATFDSLDEAHAEGLQLAAAEELFAPGGLSRLQAMLRFESAWRVDVEYRRKIAEDRLNKMGRQQCLTS